MAADLLTVSGLHAGFGDVRVLHDVDMVVKPGEIVCLIGSNGAGKTTLLRALSGVVRASAGAIGFALAGLPHQALLPPFSLGFVSLIGLAVMAPVASLVSPYGARLAHRLSRRKLEIAFGCFLLLVSLRFLASLFWL